MVRADLFFFGYFLITVDSEDVKIASNILLKNNISAAFSKNGSFKIAYRMREVVTRLFQNKVRYRISNPRGLYGILLQNKRRMGIFIGAALFAVMLFLSSDVVWDVRIEGADREEESKILHELSSAGLDVGKRWSKLDKSQIEINMLSASESVAWLNINRRGTVAYVKVSDKILYQDEEKPTGYASIVAVCDCVIEEIIVESGYPMVKKGESVRAGEVLISGVIPTELGGGFCYAAGEVIGRYSEDISVFIERTVREKVYSEPILSRTSINFFGGDVNIFKKYRHSYGECDIIEKTEHVTVGKRLPISVSKTYIQPYVTESRELSDDEIISLASDKLRRELLIFLKDKEARRMITSGNFSENGYEMVCKTVVSSDVTKIQEFEVE